MKISAMVGGRVREVHVERRDGRYLVEIDGELQVVDARPLEGDFLSLLSDGCSYEVSVERRGDAYHVRHGAVEQVVWLTDPARQARETESPVAGQERLLAQMPGRVVRLLAAQGDDVEAGQGIVVLEAMKMENEIASSRAGRVVSIEVQAGQSVEGGTLLAVIE